MVLRAGSFTLAVFLDRFSQNSGCSMFGAVTSCTSFGSSSIFRRKKTTDRILNAQRTSKKKVPSSTGSLRYVPLLFKKEGSQVPLQPSPRRMSPSKKDQWRFFFSGHQTLKILISCSLPVRHAVACVCYGFHLRGFKPVNPTHCTKGVKTASAGHTKRSMKW